MHLYRFLMCTYLLDQYNICFGACFGLFTATQNDKGGSEKLIEVLFRRKEVDSI